MRVRRRVEGRGALERRPGPRHPRDGGAGDGAEMSAHSLQQRGSYVWSELNAPHVRDPDTLLALMANGGAMHIDHGYPCRLIVPNRPGVQQTKWLARLEVV